MYDDLKDRLTGCFYTIFTPFLENENIDYENLEKYLTVLYKQGARKFYAMAYNSRYSQLNDKEILELNEFCIKTVKRLNKNIKSRNNNHRLFLKNLRKDIFITNFDLKGSSNYGLHLIMKEKNPKLFKKVI